MKNFRKIALTTAIITTWIVSFTANANETMTTSQTTNKNVMSGVKEAKTELKETREEIKVQRQDMLEQNKVLKEQIKTNREDFKTENKWAKEVFKTLSPEIQTQLKTLQEELKSAINVLQQELSNSWTTQERKDAIILEIKTLNDAHIAKVIEISGNNADVVAFFAKRQELITNNKEIRNQEKKARIDFRQWRDTQVEQYKTKYFNQLWVILPKLKDAKLEDVNARIDALIAKLDANTTMNEDRKIKMLSQVTSIKELIQEEQDNRAVVEEQTTLANTAE